VSVVTSQDPGAEEEGGGKRGPGCGKRILILLALLAGAICIGAVLYLVGSRGIHRRAPTEEEKRLLVHISELEEYGLSGEGLAACETYVAKTNLDGSLEIEYKYDSDLDPGCEVYLYLVSQVETDASVAAASESFRYLISAYKLGASAVEGREVREVPGLITLGDESYGAIIEQDGEPVGNAIVVRRGTSVHSLLLLGFTFESRELLEELLRPHILGEPPG
jgi:hypothetical protein